MVDRRRGDGRQRLLDAAAALVSAAPGQDIPLRAICDRAGVALPTLYHFFGSKEGLLDAVVEHGFATYLSAKAATESSGDPIGDLRQGWDVHVRFGLEHSGFYALMYGQVSPGRRPDAAAGPARALLGLCQQAADQGRLVVSAQQAADQVLAANVGVTLFLITSTEPDLQVSAATREATISALTGVTPSGDEEPLGALAARLLERSGEIGAALGEAETALLRKWLAAVR